jgi:hypothetical protein
MFVLRILEFCISAPAKRLLTPADRPTMTGQGAMKLCRIAHNPPEFSGMRKTRGILFPTEEAKVSNPDHLFLLA